MPTTFFSSKTRVRSGNGARCKYVKSTCRSRSRGYSGSTGSLTLTIISARAQTCSQLDKSSACLCVFVVRNTAALTSTFLNEHGMAAISQGFHTCWNHAYTVLVVFDFSWNAYNHAVSSRRLLVISRSADSLIMIDLCFLQFSAVVHVDRLPL